MTVLETAEVHKPIHQGHRAYHEGDNHSAISKPNHQLPFVTTDDSRSNDVSRSHGRLKRYVVGLGDHPIHHFRTLFMLCRVVLCRVVLCHVVLCHIVSCHVMSCHVMP